MVTMNDIAARAEVSRSTVSYVLNGRAAEIRIPDATQQRVLEIASELGYRHNALARSVAGGKSHMIGFVTEEPSGDVEFKSSVMVGVIETAAERGYTVQVLYLPPKDMRHEVVERCIEWRLAGVVALALHSRILNELHREIARYEMEMAVLEDFQAYSWAVNVSSASSDGMRQAVEHLYQLGHRRIAMIAAAADDDHSIWRERLFRKLCRERGLEIAPNNVVYGDWWKPLLNEAASRRLLQQTPRPTAVICCGDPAAMALLNTARLLGISVPHELSVVGYGNYSFSIFSDPPLTTVAQPFRELGRLAASRLLDRISDSSHDWDDLQRATLPASLVVRASTGPAPAV
jgi:DNA-binding LacI/PurR family transcriptional regulator